MRGSNWVESEFQRGCDDYWAGKVPTTFAQTGPKYNHPYLAGWNLSADMENGVFDR